MAEDDRRHLPARGASGRTDYPELSGENRAIWEAIAAWWDERIGHGNDFQRELVEPASEELLGIQEGDRILDIACGAGRFARRMAVLGADVLAFDHSEVFIGIARERSQGLKIEYRVLDAGDEKELETLNGATFDKAVCTMALMDMPDLVPLFKRLPSLLKPGGSFVFTVAHPCFSSAATQAFTEMHESALGRFESHTGIKITRYLTSFAKTTEGIVGQPRVQYMFHRPLNVLLGYGFQNGLVVDGLLEPRFPVELPEPGLGWKSMPEIPPLLAIRMRKPG
jgi:2-polyprenyl-3-methyl-5-hydroxy-6-metoxy-1,4-benzoquinol methylase